MPIAVTGNQPACRSEHNLVWSVSANAGHGIQNLNFAAATSRPQFHADLADTNQPVVPNPRNHAKENDHANAKPDP